MASSAVTKSSRIRITTSLGFTRKKSWNCRNAVSAKVAPSSQ